MGQLFQELKRRNVIRVAIAYAVSAWLLIQVADALFPMLRLPEWTATLVAVLLLIGFPIALIFAWAFELTPEGIKLEKQVVREESITRATGRKLDFVIIALLVLGLGYFAYDKFVLDPSRDAELVQATTEAVTEQITESVISENADKSIAVLPFTDLSPEGDQEHFSDGVSEEILNLLARVPKLRVTSRSSAFSFKGQNLDVPTMADKLNVAHVLEGSIRKSGNQLRITAQLIEAKTDTHLWSDTYDRELKNIFAIQDEIAAAVVDALKITLLGEKPKATETNPEAYALYLQGLHFINQRTTETHKQAETRLNQALEIDPNFAPAWTALGAVYSNTDLGQRSIDDGIELAHHAIQEALSIDPRDGQAYAVLARINMNYDWDLTAAVQNLQQALKLNPGDADILLIAGHFEDALGHADEAIELFREVVVLDPLLAHRHYWLGRMYFRVQRLQEAADSLRLALSLDPARPGAKYYLGLVLLAQGDAPAALETIEQDTFDGLRLLGTAIAQHALGDAVASDAALNELIEKYAAGWSYQVAIAYACRGEIDNAFDWLNQAYNNRDAGMTNLLLDPLLTNLHDDPRWEILLDKMGLPH
jgi:TolB-like protein/cytochrome c-type biogenesis protein CcmH/NrfG